MFYSTVLCISFTKLLFIPSYKSTDFEVHRNWLAITRNLPLNQWYFDDGSIWTLDYPPLFAWFEHFLSYFALLFDREMLRIHNLDYDSRETILFQRLSVIITDIIYAVGTYKCWKALPNTASNSSVLPVLLLTNIGLFIVDHIHFQYNGIMFGILLISVSNLLKNSNLRAAFWFSVLLNMKHIFMYIAPAYFVYLLRNYCLNATSKGGIVLGLTIRWRRLAALGAIVVGVFAASFGPFYDHLPQVLSRLFPFKRGLCHAYWAPNWWAFYNTVDSVANLLVVGHGRSSPLTRGLVGAGTAAPSHVLLPAVSPLATLLLTVGVALPALVQLWRMSTSVSQVAQLQALRAIVLCALTAFLFGWHVHEKAILMALIPMSILACVDQSDARFFSIMAAAGHYSLFPLIFTGDLLLVKLLLFISYTLYSIYSLSKLHNIKDKATFLSYIEILYLIGFSFLFLYNNVIHTVIGLHERFPFLTLWSTSLYCFLGIFYAYVRHYVHFMKFDYSKVTADKQK